MADAMRPVPPVIQRAAVQLDVLEWRESGDTGDGSYTLTGHAAVFNRWTTLYEGRQWVWREQIAPGAFAGFLAAGPDPDSGRDVHLNLGHDMNRSIARWGLSGVGGMELSEDSTGLRVFARLDPADPDVIALAAKMRRGLIDQMSFAFRVQEDTWTIYTDGGGCDIEDRTILRIDPLYDVCACAQGAYPQTDADLRGLQAAIRRAGHDPAGDSDPIVPPAAGGDSSRREAGDDTALALLKARARARSLTVAH